MSDATAFLRQQMPLTETLGIRAETFAPDGVRLAMDWAAGLCTSGGVLHGGVLMALADSAGGACAFLNLKPDQTTATIESKTNFLGAVRGGGPVTATAAPLHIGSSTIVVETEIRDERDRLVAKVTQTQAVLRSRSN